MSRIYIHSTAFSLLHLDSRQYFLHFHGNGHGKDKILQKYRQHVSFLIQVMC